jgi:hypothetical protein
MRYTIQHGYKAYRDGRQFGPWQAGDVVELAAEDAAWIERDSPGVFAEDVDDTVDLPPAGPGQVPPGSAATVEGQGERVAQGAGKPLPAEPVDHKPFSEMDFRELQAAAKARELSAGGGRDELVARLEEHERTRAEAVAVDTGGGANT